MSQMSSVMTSEESSRVQMRGVRMLCGFAYPPTTHPRGRLPTQVLKASSVHMPNAITPERTFNYHTEHRPPCRIIVVCWLQANLLSTWRQANGNQWCSSQQHEPGWQLRSVHLFWAACISQVFACIRRHHKCEIIRSHWESKAGMG